MERLCVCMCLYDILYLFELLRISFVKFIKCTNCFSRFSLRFVVFFILSLRPLHSKYLLTICLDVAIRVDCYYILTKWIRCDSVCTFCKFTFYHIIMGILCYHFINLVDAIFSFFLSSFFRCANLWMKCVHTEKKNKNKRRRRHRTLAVSKFCSRSILLLLLYR